MTLVTRYDREMNSLKQAKLGNYRRNVEAAQRMKRNYPKDYHHPAVKKLRKNLGREIADGQ